MTKSINFLFVFIALLSCKSSSPFQGPMNAVEDLKKIEAKNLASKETRDTVFLGYRFGMSPEEFINHSADLIQKKELIESNVSKKTYLPIVVSETKTLNGELMAAFHQGKLYKVGLRFDESLPGIIYPDLFDLYLKSYGPPPVMTSFVKDTYDHWWVINNMEINFRVGLSDIEVDYIDLRLEGDVKKAEKEKAKQQRDKAIKSL